MSLEPSALSDCWFTSPSLPPEDSPDLEKQCHSADVENRETLWGRIWRMLLSLVFKTETSVALSNANGNTSSTSNTRVSSDRLALDREIVTQTHLVEPVAMPVAIDMDSLNDLREHTRAQPRLGNEIRVCSPPPTRDSSTLTTNDARSSCSIWSSQDDTEPWPYNLGDEEISSTDLRDMISLIESAGCSSSLAPTPTPSARDSDVSEVMQRPRPSQRESTILPLSLYPLRP